jgi:hypothetical protein
MKVSVPFNKKTEVKEFGKLMIQLVRAGVVFNVEFDNDNFYVVLTGGF